MLINLLCCGTMTNPALRIRRRERAVVSLQEVVLVYSGTHDDTGEAGTGLLLDRITGSASLRGGIPAHAHRHHPTGGRPALPDC